MFDFSFFGATVATSGEHAALIRDKAGERQRALARARAMLGRSKRRVAEGCLKSPSFFGEPERSEGDRQGFCTPKAKQNSSRLSALSRCRFILGDRCQSLAMRFGCFPTLFIALAMRDRRALWLHSKRRFGLCVLYVFRDSCLRESGF